MSDFPESSHGHRHHSHHHHHSRHHHYLRSRHVPAFAFAFAAALLTAWSVIPLASVGFFETRILAIGTWLLAAAAAFVPAHRHDATPSYSSRAGLFVAGGLLLWCMFQLVPSSAAWLRSWHGDPELFRQISAHAGGRLRIALSPHAAFHTLLHWSGLFVLAAAAARLLRKTAAARLLLASFVALTAIECIYALSAPVEGVLRLRGTFASSDAFGGLMAMTLPLAAALLLDRLSAVRANGFAAKRQLPLILAAIAAILLLATGVFFSGSRGAAVAALATIPFLLVWCARAYPARRRLLAGILLAVLALVPLFAYNAQRQNIWDRTFGEDTGWTDNLGGRRDIWKAAFALVRAFPWGTGPGGTVAAMPIYQTAVHGRYRLDYAHNDTLQFLGDLGWPGAVLLLAGLVLLARRAVRACRSAPGAGGHPASDSPPWLARGAALALLAALVHSQAEFNLSARPPLQMVFVLLAGLLCAAPESRHHDAHASGSSGSAHSPRRSAVFPRMAISLAAAAAILLSFRAAVAYRTARSAALALGLESAATDSPLLLPSPRTLPIPPDDPALARAARLDPFSPFVRTVLASLPTAAHDAIVLDTARRQAEAVRAADLTDPDDPDEDTPPEPDPATIAAIAAALRLEEAQAVLAALPAADAAVRLAPWSSQAMTDRAWLLLRATALRAATPGQTALAHADLDLAAALYPSDAYNLSAVCAALSAEENPGNLPRILSYAERAFTLNPAAALSSMDRWLRTGIPLLPLAQLDGIPVRALRKLYQRAISSPSPDAAAEADAILARIETLVRPDAPLPPAAARWTPARLLRWNRNQARHRQWALREHLRRDLRAGDWEAVAASAPARAEARDLRFRADFEALSASPVMRRLRLREWAARNVLPRTGRIEWALAECAAGKDPDLYRDIWTEAAASAPLPPDQASRLPPGVLAEFPALASGTDSPAPPAPDNPSSLSLPYLGERLYLDGIAATPDPDRPGSNLLSLDWRFAAPPVPAGLRMSVRLRDADRRIVYRKSRTFEKAFPDFYKGNPFPGARFTATIPLPRATVWTRTLEIRLYDGKTRIPQDDLQETLSLSYPALLPPPEP